MDGSKKGFMSGLQTTSNSNDGLPLRSVPRTGCVGHCGNPRLKGGRKKSTSVSWLSFRTGFGRVNQLTANTNVLCLGDKEVSDAASCKERPQRPENLCEENGDGVSIKDANWASDQKCDQHHKGLALTGVDHLRRPKNAMGVLSGRGCTMSELSSSTRRRFGWVWEFRGQCRERYFRPAVSSRAFLMSTPSKPTTAASTTSAPGVSPVRPS
jgi:hypothetical protein